MKKTRKISLVIKDCDNAHSKYVIARDGGCMFHAKCFEKKIFSPCRCGGVLQCCHKYSRSKRAIKYHEDNVFAGCQSSNAWAHFSEVKWDKLWRKLWPENVKLLDELADAPCQRKRVDYQWLTQDFKKRTR